MMQDDSELCITLAIGIIIFCGFGLFMINGTKYSMTYHEVLTNVGVEFEGYTGDVTGMRAMVKGSIYGNGEGVSVFGTCMDWNSFPVPNTNGSLSAWYPNGTVYLINSSMTNLSSGYFLYAGNMSVVSGTYLTEFTCTNLSNNDTAKTWGEWQNPVWVQNIANTLNASNQTYALIMSVNDTVIGINMSLTSQIIDLNATIEDINLTVENINTNITFIRQNMTDSFKKVEEIANASVDRNNSLLATLLYALLNYSGTPITANLTWIESYEHNPVYRGYFGLDVTAYNEYGQKVGVPGVYCTVNTTYDTTPLNMTYTLSSMLFSKSLFVATGEFEWTTRCYYAASG